MLKGALAAAVTPLQDAGEALDEAAFGPYVEFLAAGGVDGLLALGTTGEGFLLPVEQRMRAAQLFLEAAGGRILVAVHCGAQSTWDTVELAAHAADLGADGIAVMAPPYFTLDAEELAAHFAAAARACDPVAFYVYEFATRSGYAVPLVVLERLREGAPNFRGLKVSDTPWSAFAPYLIEGLDVFVGPEALLARGLAAGAAGAVSALASVFPELIVAALRDPGSADLGPVRAALERFPFQAAAKVVLAARGVPIRPDVRRPLRTLTTEERGELEAWLESSSPAAAR
jgi:dihydrodipicolinate synthase/N-acetylneuraminate lyase